MYDLPHPAFPMTPPLASARYDNTQPHTDRVHRCRIRRRTLTTFAAFDPFCSGGYSAHTTPPPQHSHSPTVLSNHYLHLPSFLSPFLSLCLLFIALWPSVHPPPRPRSQHTHEDNIKMIDIAYPCSLPPPPLHTVATLRRLFCPPPPRPAFPSPPQHAHWQPVSEQRERERAWSRVSSDGTTRDERAPSCSARRGGVLVSRRRVLRHLRPCVDRPCQGLPPRLRPRRAQEVLAGRRGRRWVPGVRGNRLAVRGAHGVLGEPGGAGEGVPGPPA